MPFLMIMIRRYEWSIFIGTKKCINDLRWLRTMTTIQKAGSTRLWVGERHGAYVRKICVVRACHATLALHTIRPWVTICSHTKHQTVYSEISLIETLSLMINEILCFVDTFEQNMTCVNLGLNTPYNLTWPVN